MFLNFLWSAVKIAERKTDFILDFTQCIIRHHEQFTVLLKRAERGDTSGRYMEKIQCG